MLDATEPAAGVPRRPWWALVAILTALAWWPSLRNGFAWDDRQLIVENDRLMRQGAVARAFQEDFWEQDDRAGRSDYYRPLVTVSYVLDRAAWDLDPRGYHRTNVFAHAATAALLCSLLAAWGLSARQAAVASLAWSLHPALAESVAWVSGRTDVLAAAFAFATLRFDAAASTAARRFLAPLALALALLSKEVASLVPVLAVGASVLRGAPLRSALLARWGLFAVLAAWFGVRAAVLGSPTAATTVGTGLDVGTRLVALLHLPGVLAFPWASRVEYGTGLPVGTLLPSACLGLGLLSFVLWRSRSADARVRTLLLGVALTYAPAIAAVVWKGVIADRLLYVPAAFLLPAVLLAIPRTDPVRLRAGIALAATGALLSQARIPWWRTERDLFERALRSPHPSARVHLNLAIALHDEGLLRRSWSELHLAARELRLESVSYTRALIETEIGCYDLAMADYQDALTILPTYVPAANNLGALLAELGRPQAARQVLSDALRRSEVQPEELVLNLRGLPAQGDAGTDAETLPEALSCGSPAGALARIQDARHLNRRALDRMRQQQWSQAGILLRAALDVDPGLLAIHLNRAQWHLLQGRFDLAEESVRTVLAREPGQADAIKIRERIAAARAAGASPRRRP